MDEHERIFDALRAAETRLAQARGEEKERALRAVADALEDERALILEANREDIEAARAEGMKEALLERLLLNEARAREMAEALRTIAALEDPVGRVTAGWTRPNGLFIEEVAVPIGVVAIIYESRPNVTVDAFALAYKAGCAILLRGSHSARRSNEALVAAIQRGLAAGGGIPDALALFGAQRDDIDVILRARGKIDALLPRGGAALIRRVVENARVPVIETGEGNCHIYVDASANLENALRIIENAKTQRPGACNAVETVLIHRSLCAAFAPLLAQKLAGRVELRADEPVCAAIRAAGAPPTLTLRAAREEDWETEYLDMILAVKIVDSLDQALLHIKRFGTGHSEAIITEDLCAARRFQREADAACVYVNASTRFTDGGAFGFGAELGISTQKFHARGPMGLDALTTRQFRIHGEGQIRL
jgi:glutamate-5-semialdehyde dehydrogenase